MIKEIVAFTESLSADFLTKGILPKNGLHILITLVKNNDEWSLDLQNMHHERYTKQRPVSPFLNKCMMLGHYAWGITHNKRFDAPIKAIHSCSPLCVGFQKMYLKGESKYKENDGKQKEQMYDGFERYFQNALALLDSEQEKTKYKVFSDFFTDTNKDDYFEKTLDDIFKYQKEQQASILKKYGGKQTQQAKKELEEFKELGDKDFIIFYLDESLQIYQTLNNKFLKDKLFNTQDFPLSDQNQEIFGVSSVFNTLNTSKPFLVKRTATFNVPQRISSREARMMHEFQLILKRKVLPNPLPIFISKEELQKDFVTLYTQNEKKLGYLEVIEQLWENHKNDFGNYYLFFYQNGNIKDFDYVAQFDFALEGNAWELEPLFPIKKIHFGKVKNVAMLEAIMHENVFFKHKKQGGFKLKLGYFDEAKSLAGKGEEIRKVTERDFLKYRQAFYNFIYKSQRQAFTQAMFDDVMLSSILDNLKLDEWKEKKHTEYGNIRRKLNIWFSLSDNFNLHSKQTNTTMASQLKAQRKFIEDLVDEKTDTDTDQATTDQFAFVAGQVVSYLLSKSKSSDKSYRGLERYLQQSNFEGFKQVITAEFARYKHEVYTKKFRAAASFVLSYQTNDPVKKYLPQVLAGVFSDNMLFPKAQDTKQDNQTEETDRKSVV